MERCHSIEILTLQILALQIRSGQHKGKPKSWLPSFVFFNAKIDRLCIPYGVEDT
jgi:hypothetical protein